MVKDLTHILKGFDFKFLQVKPYFFMILSLLFDNKFYEL